MPRLSARIAEAFRAGADYVQIREKDLPGGPLFAFVAAMAALPERNAVPGAGRLLVNSRADVALAAGADGVHLPFESLPLARLRNRWPDGFIAGVSCHSQQEVAEAVAAAADYVVVGPVFPTPSKPGAAPLGLAALASICRSRRVPVLALGGVDLSNARACLEAGAAGIAGIRLFQQAGDLGEVVRQIRAL